jgi:hypothetical protein
VGGGYCGDWRWESLDLQENDRLTTKAAAARLLEHGYVRVPGLFSHVRMQELESEAGELYPTSDRYIHDVFDIDGATVVTSPATFRLARGGPVLCRTWASASLVRMLSSMVGAGLTPTRCSYNYYESQDHIGLHVDIDECQLTVTFGLWDVGPVLMYPEFRAMRPADLLELAVDTGGRPDGGTPLEMDIGTAIVMTGHTTPHRRPAFERDLAAVGALCYRINKENA